MSAAALHPFGQLPPAARAERHPGLESALAGRGSRAPVTGHGAQAHPAGRVPGAMRRADEG